MLSCRCRSSGHQRHCRQRQRRLCRSPRGCSRSRVGCRTVGPPLCSRPRRTRSFRRVVAGVVFYPGCCAGAKQTMLHDAAWVVRIFEHLSKPFGVHECACWHRGGSYGPPTHSQRGRGRYRAPANGGRGAYEGNQHGGMNGAYEGNDYHGAVGGGRRGFVPAGPSGGVQRHAESFRGRGPYVPPAGRSARNPYAVPQPADAGRGGPAGRSRGRGRGGRTRG